MTLHDFIPVMAGHRGCAGDPRDEGEPMSPLVRDLLATAWQRCEDALPADAALSLQFRRDGSNGQYLATASCMSGGHLGRTALEALNALADDLEEFGQWHKRATQWDEPDVDEWEAMSDGGQRMLIALDAMKEQLREALRVEHLKLSLLVKPNPGPPPHSGCEVCQMVNDTQGTGAVIRD